jgi:hypothetical protein
MLFHNCSGDMDGIIIPSLRMELATEW